MPVEATPIIMVLVDVVYRMRLSLDNLFGALMTPRIWKVKKKGDPNIVP